MFFPEPINQPLALFENGGKLAFKEFFLVSFSATKENLQ
jgi:hypothetical protein